MRSPARSSLSTAPMHRAAAIVLTGVVALIASRVRAETGVPWDTTPPCASAEPVIAATLPANVPGFVFRGGATDVSVMALDGTAIPITLAEPDGGYMVVGLDASLTEGEQYTLQWSDECTSGRTRSFTATAPRPLPTTAGTLSATRRSDALYCDAAGRPEGFVTADLRLNESTELLPFLDVAAVDIVAEGDPSFVTGSTYGAASSDVVGVIGQKCPFGPREFLVHARVRIPNGPTVDTAAIDVSLPCPTTCMERPVGTVPDAGASDAGGGPAANEGDDTVTASCAAGSSATTGASVSLVAMVLAGCLQILRRMRSRR